MPSVLDELRSAHAARPVVGIIGGAVAGSEAAALCAQKGAVAVVFEQGLRPYGKIEDGLPRWHVKLRKQEYAAIDDNLTKPGVIFVPLTRIGEHISWQELTRNYGFSAAVLANGAWNDRTLPIAGADQYVGKGLLYQNPFVHWFNHYVDENYRGPRYSVPDETIVVGGGLASIDVVKIINLELYQQALKQRGIEVDMIDMELKGIDRVLADHSLTREALGIEGCTLYYRRRKEDMPLASMDNPTPEQLKKIENARVKIMDRVIRKYLVNFVPLHAPVELIVKDDRLAGLQFQRNEVVNGRLQAATGPLVDVHAPLIISSIGSVPRPIEGIPTKGELYDFADWQRGTFKELSGVFGLGNVLTGKGNIKDSRDNAIEIIEKVVSGYLGLEHVAPPPSVEPRSTQLSSTAEAALTARPTSAQAQRILGDKLKERYNTIGYVDYQSWLGAHPPS